MTAISVIVPVHNAERTLERTLRSLRAQTLQDWEAVLVDDGSSDGSPAIIRRWNQSDRRIRAIRQDQAGASAARNAALTLAGGTWIIFLDADDELAPHHLAMMLAASRGEPEADILHCGWRRMAGKQPWRDTHAARRLTDPMLETARACPFAIHAALTRRQPIVDVGGFDPALRIAEDWDLWQRLARSGARFVPVENIIADVHVEPRSLSSDSARHLMDGLTVIRRGHDVDPRLPANVPFAAGASGADLPNAAWCFAVWIAAAMAGRGGSPSELLAGVETPFPAELDANALAGIIEDGLSVGAGPGAGSVYRRWSAFAPTVAALCEDIGARAGSVSLGAQILREVQVRVAQSVPPGEEAQVGSIAVLVVDPARRIKDRELPGCDRIWVSAVADQILPQERHLGFGALSSERQWAMLRDQDSPELRRRLLAQRLRDGPFGLGLPVVKGIKEYARLLLSRRKPYRHLHATLPHEDVRHLLYQVDPNGPPGHTAEGGLAAIVAEERAKILEVDGRAGPTVDMGKPWVEPDYTREDYWETIFTNVDPWSYRNSYETLKYDQTIDLIRHVPVAHALEIACAEGEFTRRLAAHADHVLATDIAPTAVTRAAEACSDLDNCAFQRLDLLTEDPPGRYDLIVASEVLYYLDPQALAAFVDKVACHLNPGGIFLTAHGNLLVDEPDKTGFGWPHHFGAKGIGNAFATHGEFSKEAELWTPLYRIMRFRKTAAKVAQEPQMIVADAARALPERVASQVRWRGGREAPVVAQWHDLPILMYHRIAFDGPASLARWRTTPERFEAQLDYLRREGWQGISMKRLRQALHEGAALPERSVMFTFDDATRDFCDHALPLLHRYGFPATLFVPVGHVGGAATWDDGHGEPAPLLDWDALRMLIHCDVSIGAHGVTHRPLTTLDAENVVRELAGGRFQLERELGSPIDAIAYPYGAFDQAIRNAAYDCDYRFGFTCLDGRVRQDADPMALFRREVPGDIGLDQFAALVEGR